MKKILITGGSSGLGFELAKLYLEIGHYLILVGRNEEKLKKATNELKNISELLEYIVCDISNFESINKLENIIVENHSTIDYLVNNAGIGYFGPFEELNLIEISEMLDVNVKGTICVTKSLIDITNEKIINIISTAGLIGKVNEAVYVASKFAIRGFTESLQKEYANEKLEIIAVYMGGMNTNFWNNSDHIKDKTRLASPESIAKEIILKDDGRLEIILGNKN